jgi:hypothetical protein
LNGDTCGNCVGNYSGTHGVFARKQFGTPHFGSMVFRMETGRHRFDVSLMWKRSGGHCFSERLGNAGYETFID